MTEVPNAVLAEMYRSRKTHAADGAELDFNAEIRSDYAAALYRIVAIRRPTEVLEVGMACGASSLAILTGLSESGNGRLTSIDPFQESVYRGAGIEAVRRAGFLARHRHVNAYDYLGLPRLLQEGLKLDMAYIDGMHTFDYTLLDFFYVDKMLRPGGVVGFNDCGYRAVARVLKFVRTHRHYRALDVGLARDYRGRNGLLTVARRVVDLSQEDRYFEKLDDWEPSWNYYARF